MCNKLLFPFAIYEEFYKFVGKISDSLNTL